MKSDSDIFFMEQAFEQAQVAFNLGETPVGAVVVVAGRIVGAGYNRVETDGLALRHAELTAIWQASQNIKDWRLEGATLYSTLEPCIMCAGAILHSRIAKVVYAAYDHKWGAFGSLFDFAHDPRLNHEIEIVSGVLAERSEKMLKTFFNALRNQSASEINVRGVTD